MGFVFAILILLVFILKIFHKVAEKGEKAPEAKAEAVAAPKAVKVSAADADAEMEAAIATALYLFTAEVHDVESDVLTIVHNDRTKWGPIR